MNEQREFQRKVGEQLRLGRSVLQVAPTGLGKTRGAIEPFTSGDGRTVLDTRLIYALPLRSLIEGICRDLVELGFSKLSQSVEIKKEETCDELRKKLVSYGGMSIGLHYGEKPESMIFSEKACVTTIDQYLAAFAGAPLSSFTDTTTRWRYNRTKVGHAVAGAVMTSYSVFDEAHLLDPRNGLQLLMAVLSQRQRWGLLSTVSTATLPTSVIEYLTQDEDGPQLALVEATVADIAQRDDHRKVTMEIERGLEPLASDDVVGLCITGLKENSKVILFANTVDRAMEYYKKLKEKLDDRVMLIHSRFASDDRRKKEEQVQNWFGRDSTEDRCVLVTTQVAEAGLNISAPLALSELCPADSLVQRAGRCKRFARQDGFIEGRVVVFKPEAPQSERTGRRTEAPYWLPYPQAVIKKTEEALVGFAGVFNWQRERELVDAALGELYGAWVRGENVDEELDNKGQPQKRSGRLRPIDALGPFERAFRGGSANELQQWLRNPEGRPLRVQVAVAESEEEARDQILTDHYPDTVNLPFGVLYRRQDENSLKMWETDPHGAKSGNEQAIVRVTRPTPGRTYLLLQSEAGYSEDMGLTLRGEGKSLGWRMLDRAEREQEQGCKQTFHEHTLGTFRKASRMIEHYIPFLEAWARAVFGNENAPNEIAGALVDAMKVAAMFHDVGKLDARWQNIARKEVKDIPERTPIARFPRRDRADERNNPLPPHAAFAYPFLRGLFREANGEGAFLRPLEFIALAAARHHSLRVDGAIKPGDFEPFDVGGSLAALIEVSDASGIGVENSWIETAFNRIADAKVWKDEPYYADEAPSPSDDFYPIYCIAQRLVKVADWEDAGNKDIELTAQEAHDENA